MFKEARARWHARRITKAVESLKRLGYGLVRIDIPKNGKVQVYIRRIG